MTPELPAAEPAAPYIDPNADPTIDWKAYWEGVYSFEDVETQDGEPLENIAVERQQKALVEPIYTGWEGPAEGVPFLSVSNVGVFYQEGQPAVVPDVLLSVGVRLGSDLTHRYNRSYFVSAFGKPPDAVVEIVSDRRGGELGHKMSIYARIGVPCYAVYDPNGWLGEQPLRTFQLTGGAYQEQTRHWFPVLRLGLTLWDGVYQGVPAQYLRWCDEKGVVLPTGAEKAAEAVELLAERDRQLELERQARQRLEQRLRELGIDP